MRIRRMRAVIVLLCMALILVMGAWQASASVPDLLSSSGVFSGFGVRHSEPASINMNFFRTMLGAVPEGDSVATVQPAGSYGMSLRLPSSSPRISWMSDALSSGVSPDMSTNPALTSYNRLVARFPDQPNLFGP